jgi:beta-glucosidase
MLRSACLILLCVSVSPYMVAQQPAPTDQGLERQVNHLLLGLTLDQKLELLGGKDRKFIRGVPDLHLPDVMMSDGPVGVSVTVVGTRALVPSNNYAAGIALAATWDPDLARRVGEELGKDARSRGVGILLGPAVNIVRAPMDGRAFEYFGEDPWLASRMAVSYIQGVQSQGVVATVKHFVANNSEFDRNNTNSVVDEQTLHELYLPAFEAAVEEAKVGAVMDSYNLLSGVHLTQNCAMNMSLLRNTWGFRGILMSDWDATYDGVQAARCGLDLEMPFARFMTKQRLNDALQAGDINIATIDAKVANILRTELRFGLVSKMVPVTPALYTTSSRQIALQSAIESIVLLKNKNNLLPLSRKTTRTLAVIGPDAYPAVPGGGGSSHVESFQPVSLLGGLVDVAGDGTTVLYQRGLPSPQEIFAQTVFDPGNPSGRLTLQEFDKADFSGQPRRVEFTDHIDQWHTEVWAPPQPNPKYLRWTGSFTPLHTGRYLFLAGAFNRDTYEVFVDGHLVLQQPPAEGQAPRSIEMDLVGDKAIHLEVRYVSTNATPRMGFGIRSLDDLISPAARQAAADADAVLLAVGFDATEESEGYDRTFELPWGQDALIETIAQLNKHMIVTLTAGGGVDMTHWLSHVPALLYNWYPGQEGGHAIASVLFGDLSPSGKLPVTLDRTWQDNPVRDFYYPHPGSTDVHYGEGLFLGYRYYTSSSIKPQFPFGFGLSYTTFRLSNLSVKRASSLKGAIRVSLDIQNTGRRRGADVCQLYIGLSQPQVKRPVKELKAFQRVDLLPGHSRHISFVVSQRSLSYFDPTTHAWRPASGIIHLYAGDSSETTLLRADFGSAL